MNSSQKSDLRKHYGNVRRSLPSDVVRQKSLVLSEHIINELDWEKIKRIHCFLPLVGQNEPDIRPAIQYAVNAGKQVFTSNPHNQEVLRLEDGDAKSIKEYELADNIEFDAIITPMLAYDPATRQRLGFGGGFYDRLLAKQPAAYTLGVCFSECIVSLPSESHDIPLDDCLIA